MAPRRVHVRVSGLVQGVAFRHHTRREAMRLGLCGWVRNTADGSVELECEGSDEAVERLLRWLHHGPPRAFVERVDWRGMDAGSTEGFLGLDFQIRPTV